jgi:chorismate mutase
MPIRGVRGAVCARENTKEAIEQATHELMLAMLGANPTLHPADVASILFTMTEDLNATYPALAARQIGWHETPLLCAKELEIPGSLGRCIRVLLHWNTELAQTAVQHVYLGEAAALRPDLAAPSSQPNQGVMQ